MARILGLLLLISSGLHSQQLSVAEQYARTIESNAIRTHVFTLASKDFEGRETGTEGNRKAAQYIANQFASFDIPPIPGTENYFQNVAFTNVKWSDIKLTLSGSLVDHLRDYLSIPQYFPVQDKPIEIQSMIFLGYGIDDPAYSDYADVDVKGKHLLIYGGEPRDANENFRISGTHVPSNWSTDPFLKMETARKAGAASIWVIEDNLREQITFARRNYLSGSTLMGSPDELTNQYLPHALITSGLGQRIAGKKVGKMIKLRNKITKSGKPFHATIPVDVNWTVVHQIKSTPGANVLGFVEGVDPILHNEVVVITAHYDHLGMRGNDIFFGADDNASGTSAVLEIAHAFAQAKFSGQGPRRSVLCMLVTGEEKGLLGSQYYVEHPIFPLENTVVNINIDMIGRVDSKHDNANYTYVIGSDRLSTELHAINETANRLYTQLDLDYTYNEDDDPNRFYYRSDHYNFTKNGIPAIFYFSGVHDDYHRPTDTPDKIMFDKAVTITRLAFHTAWELANRDERIKVDVTGRN